MQPAPASAANPLPFPIAVLKFGGSILAGEEHLRGVVHDVYRFLRAGYRVVAVVSAFQGETNRLIDQAKRFVETPHPNSLAKLAATGELTSASLLGLALDRAGVSVEVLDSAAIGLRTHGHTLDAEPASVDTAAIRRALEHSSVLVVPGFIGRDERNRTTLLGRGGSDFTALFLADALRAERCSLIKDVEGLYDRDPQSATPTPANTAPPRLYATISWADAIALGGKVLQEKAIRFALDRKLTFEIVGQHQREGTTIGDLPSHFADELAPSQPTAPRQPLRVALLGHGSVGAGVRAVLAQLPEQFTVTAVAVRDTAKAIAAGCSPALLSIDPLQTAKGDYDILVETMGGLEPAKSAIVAALTQGRHVVTANKAVIAAFGDELHTLAARHHGSLSYSAAVGGAVPVLETIRRLTATSTITSVEALLNGTTNFVLGEVSAGKTFEQAVKAAQDAGFAEADPSRDLGGLDAQDKLILLARAAFGPAANDLRVEREALSPDSLARAAAAGKPGDVVRHVVRLSRVNNELKASIKPEPLAPSHPLAGVQREGNAILVTTADGIVHQVFGKGAGRWPTAEAVVADLLDLDAARSMPSAAGPSFLHPPGRTAVASHQSTQAPRGTSLGA